MADILICDIDNWRTCIFCGCRTNAVIRACCDKGKLADMAMREHIDEMRIGTCTIRICSECPAYRHNNITKKSTCLFGMYNNSNCVLHTIPDDCVLRVINT